MATGNVINSVQIMRSLIAELKTIKKSEGYSTDVATVRQPDYLPPKEQDDEGWNQAMAEVTPAILVWLDTETEDESLATTMKDRPVLSVYVLGIIKQEKGIQETIQMLASDVRRVFRNNMNRDHPTATATNTWGVMTAQGGSGLKYGYAKSQSSTVAMFDVIWSMTYNFPRATG